MKPIILTLLGFALRNSTYIYSCAPEGIMRDWPALAIALESAPTGGTY